MISTRERERDRERKEGGYREGIDGRKNRFLWEFMIRSKQFVTQVYYYDFTILDTFNILR